MKTNINIKKLRKYHLFESYTNFLKNHNTVLFVNASSQKVRVLLKPLGLPINVLACKNTLLKKKYMNYEFFNNVLIGDVCLVGLNYMELSVADCKKVYEILMKTEGTIVLGGLYFHQNNKSVFYLPLDASILKYHHDMINTYCNIVGVTLVPVAFGSVEKLYSMVLSSYYFFLFTLKGMYTGLCAVSQWSDIKNRQI